MNLRFGSSSNYLESTYLSLFSRLEPEVNVSWKENICETTEREFVMIHFESKDRYLSRIFLQLNLHHIDNVPCIDQELFVFLCQPHPYVNLEFTTNNDISLFPCLYQPQHVYPNSLMPCLGVQLQFMHICWLCIHSYTRTPRDTKSACNVSREYVISKPWS